MANITSIQILEDGQRNVVAKFIGVLDTSDLGSTTVLDPATLSAMNGESTGPKATKLRINKLMFNVEDTLSVNLFWDATTPVLIEELVGRGKMDYKHFGGLKNNAGTYDTQGIFTPAAGFTGKITATTQGWGAASTLSFTMILECVKQ
jgi:hypothetical protein